MFLRKVIFKSFVVGEENRKEPRTVLPQLQKHVQTTGVTVLRKLPLEVGLFS